MAREYIQFAWQKKRIHGRLKKLNGMKLYVAGPTHSPKKVIPYIDEFSTIFIKNPYNINWIDFLSCDHFFHGDYHKLFT